MQAISVDQSPIQVVRQFDGLNARNTAELNNLPIEPPNPGVCVGGGYVVEVTNLVRVPALLPDLKGSGLFSF